MILSSYPKIDLHGMDREYAVFKVREFILDCYRLKYENIVIIQIIVIRKIFIALFLFILIDIPYYNNFRFLLMDLPINLSFFESTN